MYLLFRVLLAQLILLGVAGSLGYGLSPNAGLSVVVGGLIFVVPNTYFLMLALRFAGTSSAFDAAQAFYKGQMGKLTLSAVGFALAFKFYEQLQPALAFAGFMLMMVGHLALATYLSNRMAELGQRGSINH